MRKFFTKSEVDFLLDHVDCIEMKLSVVQTHSSMYRIIHEIVQSFMIGPKVHEVM